MDPVSPEARLEAYCYGIAVCALYHPERWWPGQWWSLQEMWPPRTGPPPNLFADNYAAQAVRLGATKETVAAAWDTTPDSSRSKIDRAPAPTLELPDAWGIEVVTGDEAAAILNVPPERIAAWPRDPDSDEAQIAALSPDWDWMPQDDGALGCAMKATGQRPPPDDANWCDDLDA